MKIYSETERSRNVCTWKPAAKCSERAIEIMRNVLEVAVETTMGRKENASRRLKRVH